MPFSISLPQYSGPLHLLLELIEKKELPITDISLSQVAEDFLTHVNNNEPPPAELADFLVVATRLLLIKSHEILPREEELLEEEKSSLAAQLQLYQFFTRAADLLDAQHQSSALCFTRAQADVVKPERFEPPEGLTPDALSLSMRSLLKYLEPFFKIQQAALERVVSIKERLAQIHSALLTRARMTFRDMLSNTTSKVDVVVSFLALLELLKQRTVRVVQSSHFGEIEVKRVD